MAATIVRHRSNTSSDSTIQDENSKSFAYVSGYGAEGRIDDETPSITDSADDAWTENTDVPRRRMGMVQVASLVINQMMGAGIFNLPAQVLLMTGSKQLGVALWVLGGFYTFLTGIMFVEYSSAFPYTGGPLIWFDEIFYKPPMLAANVFAWYWNLLATTGNTQDVARHILSLIYPTGQFGEGLVRLVAVFVLTVICILLFVARRACFMFNTAFALFKVVVVLVVFIAGITTAVKQAPETGLQDFSHHQSGQGGFATLGAMIYVSYSYQGWEHTNYIAGEIKHPQKSLRRGVFFGIIVGTIMYTLVVVALYAAMTYSEIVSPVTPRVLGLNFANKVFGDTRGMVVVMMLSSGSCALALTYTMTKVRQAIAWQRIVPFYKFIGRQNREFDSPGGALLMHWVFSTIQIAATPTVSSASQFWYYLYTYGYQIEIAVLGIGLLWIGKRMRLHDPRWKSQNMPSRWFLVVLVIAIVGFAVTVLVAVAMDYTMNIHNYWMILAIVSIMVAAFIHWASLQLLSRRTVDGRTVGQKYVGLEVKIHTCGDDDESEMSEGLRSLMREARADGTCRRVEYTLHGRLKASVDRLTEWLSCVARWTE